MAEDIQDRNQIIKLGRWPAFILFGAGLLLLSANLRLFSYLALALSAPLSPTNRADSFATSLRQIEGSLDGFGWLGPILLVAGCWWLDGKTTFRPALLPLKLKSYWLPLAILLAGTLLRLWPMLGSGWLEIKADYDEGVYMMGARLFGQGYAPYRDYFFAHPPAAIYGLLPAALFGGGSATLIWLARFTAILWGAGTGWLVWLTGRQLGGNLAGLVALLALELDGIGVFLGHEMLLEFQANFFAMLAVYALVRHLSQPKYGQNWLYISGAAVALAAATRLNGGIIIIPLTGLLLFQRRWLESLKLLLATLLGTLVLWVPVLVRGGFTALRQVVFYQLLRDGDGITRADRFDSFSFDARPYLVIGNSRLTLLLVILGVAGWLVMWRKCSQGPLLAMLAGWGSLTLALFYFSPAFFVHYYLSFLPLLALAAGGLTGLFRILRPRHAIIAGVLVLLVCLPGAFTQFSTLFEPGSSPGSRYFGNYIAGITTPGTTVQTFDMSYNLASDRPLPRSPDGRFLIDSYGGLQYETAGLANQSIFSLTKDLLSGRKIPSSRQQVINSPAAQQLLSELMVKAGLVVLDERGRDYTAPGTGALLKTATVNLVDNAILAAYASELSGTRANARQWLALNLPRNAKVWIETGTLHLPGGVAITVGSESWQHSPEWYRQQGYTHLLIASDNYGRFFKPGANDSEAARGYRALVQGGQLLATFTPNRESITPQPLDSTPGRLDLLALPGAAPVLALSQKSSGAVFAGKLTLTQFAFQDQITTGKVLPLTLFWRKTATGSLPGTTKLFVHFLDAQGNKLAQLDTPLVTIGLPANGWPLAETVVVDADLNLPSGLSAGQYHLVAGLYQGENGQRLGAEGPGVLNGAIDLGIVTVR